MDLKKYKKTRYQNIYKHIKNGNYVAVISNPKTSINRINGQKIFKIEEAVKIRDNPKIKMQKGAEINCKDDFDTLYKKYLNDCENVQKLTYNTINKKRKFIKKNKINFKVLSANKMHWSKYINNLKTTDKQKNEILKQLKAFYNWLKDEKIYILNPISKIKPFKVEQTEMGYWLPEELKQFIEIVKIDLKDEDILIRKRAIIILTFVKVCFILGDRVGETRALAYDCIDKSKLILNINHSINYNPKSNDFLSTTKTYESQRTIDIPFSLVQTIDDYKRFMIVELNYPVLNSDIIFFNYSTNRPYSYSYLRDIFYYYCDKAQVTKIRLYDLRHTYAATMMLEGKEAYLFSQRMGHKDINTTINVYGHLSNKVRKELANSTDKYL